MGVEKLCPIPYSRKMVDPEGWVGPQPLANGRNMPKTDQGNPYAVRIKTEKRPPAWLPYYECPVRKGYLRPEDKDDRGCDGDDGMGNFTPSPEKECCHHLQRVILNRKAQKTERTREYNAKFANARDKELSNLLAEAMSASQAAAQAGSAREQRGKKG